jgi:hypothetical protein
VVKGVVVHRVVVMTTTGAGPARAGGKSPGRNTFNSSIRRRNAPANRVLDHKSSNGKHRNERSRTSEIEIWTRA